MTDQEEDRTPNPPPAPPQDMDPGITILTEDGKPRKPPDKEAQESK